jgi:hypothetical protein
MLKPKSLLAMGLVATMAFGVGITLGSDPSPAFATAANSVAVSPPGLLEVGKKNPLGISVGSFPSGNYQATVKLVGSGGQQVNNGTFEQLGTAQSSLGALTGLQRVSGSALGFSGTRDNVINALTSVTWNPASQVNSVTVEVSMVQQPGSNEFFNPQTGRYYRYVSSTASWSSARDAASNATLFGLKGYLVHITSAAENEFIANNTDAQSIWIGATDQAVEGRWVWDGLSPALKNAGVTIGNEIGFEFDRYTASTGLTGSSQAWTRTDTGVTTHPDYRGWTLNGSLMLDRAAWALNEPNNYGGIEHCAVTNWSTTKGRWNDLGCSSTNAYLIEFGGRSDDPAGGSTGITAITRENVASVTVPAAPAISSITGGNGTLNSRYLDALKLSIVLLTAPAAIWSQ